jgi:hypothetical protein
MSVLEASHVTTRRHLGAPAIVAGGLVAGCVALRVVDPAGGPAVCPFKAWTGLDCPGCGATRAAHQLLNGHLATALSLNAAFVVAVPFLAWWIGAWLLGHRDGSTIRTPHVSPTVLRVLIVVLVVFAVARNLPVAPLSWLGTGT